LPGATVTAQGTLNNQTFTFSAVTDANGNYTLRDSAGRTCVPQGNVTLVVTEMRHQTSIIDPVAVPGQGNASVPVQLVCTKVQGKVVSDADSSPVTNAVVVLTDSDGTSVAVSVNSTDGSFVFNCVKHGVVTLWCNNCVMSLVVTIDPPGVSGLVLRVVSTCG